MYHTRTHSHAHTLTHTEYKNKSQSTKELNGLQQNALKLQWCIKHSGTIVLCNKLCVSTKEELDNVNTPAVTKRHESICCPLAEFTEERTKKTFCRI